MAEWAELPPEEEVDRRGLGVETTSVILGAGRVGGGCKRVLAETVTGGEAAIGLAMRRLDLHHASERGRLERNSSEGRGACVFYTARDTTGC